MTPTMQTSFGKDAGNCFQACIASLLDRPLADVPHFCAEPEEWFAKFVRWLHGHGLTCIEVVFRPRAKRDAFFKAFGLAGTGYAIASGKSPRGDFDHSVIISVSEEKQLVEFVHDPHPSGDMLDDLEALLFIMPGSLAPSAKEAANA